MSSRSEPAVLRAGALAATFHPGAGMLCSSLLRDGHELLGLRDGLAAYVEQGTTFGIPFLHPWANRLSRERFALAGRTVDATGARRDEHGLPIHGLLGASPDWRVEAAGERHLVARHGWDGARRTAFPFPHDVELAVTLAPDGLTLSTTVTATEAVDVPVSFGFHPYLALGGGRAEARVGLPAMRRLELDGRGLPTGEHEPAEATDGPLGARVYDDAFDRVVPGARFAAGELSVVFEEGFPVAQVFAPPGGDFICFEPMTAPVDALVTGRDLPWARPGAPYRAVWRLLAGGA